MAETPPPEAPPETPPAPAPSAAPPAAPPETPPNGNWYGGLPETDRSFVTTKGWDKRGVAGMLTDYRQLEGKLGKDTVVLPGKDATDEQLDKFYGELGWPGKPDGYEFRPPEDFPVDEKLSDRFRVVAHKARLTAPQAEAIYADIVAFQKEQAAEYKAAGERDLAQLRAEKGGGFAALESAARQAIEQFVPHDDDGKPDVELLNAMEKMVGTAPFMHIWGAVGQAISNFSALDGSAGGALGLGGMTPQAAKAELAKIREARAKDDSHPLNNRRNPGYKDAQERWEALIKIANPEPG
jgi:hypothetical protein